MSHLYIGDKATVLIAYKLLLVALPSKSSCPRQPIPSITLGLRFLDNPTRNRHPVDTYSAAIEQPPRAGWSYHVPGFCLTLHLGPHSSPGYLEDALGSQNQSPDSRQRVKNKPAAILLVLLDQAY